MSDFSIRTTYKPGEGYFGYLPGSDKPAMRWGHEFRAMMAERARAAQEQRKAEEAAAEPFTRAELTQEDIKELAAKYAPDNMTQEEYDAFLGDLIEKGVMEKEDLKYIDYRGELIPNGQFVSLGSADPSLWENGGGFISASSWTGDSCPSYAALDVRPDTTNVLAWAKEMSLWKLVGSPNPALDANNRRYGIFNTLADTLGAMQRQRMKDRL